MLFGYRRNTLPISGVSIEQTDPSKTALKNRLCASLPVIENRAGFVHVSHEILRPIASTHERGAGQRAHLWGGWLVRLTFVRRSRQEPYGSKLGHLIIMFVTAICPGTSPFCYWI